MSKPSKNFELIKVPFPVYASVSSSFLLFLSSTTVIIFKLYFLQNQNLADHEQDNQILHQFRSPLKQN